MEITDQKLAARQLEKKIGQLQLLFDLAASVARAEESGEIYRAAVQGLVRVVGADRAAVLEYDSDNVMRFKASIGLSDRYRADMRGRPTWARGARDAQPITVADVLQDPSRSAFRDIFEGEGIRSLALIPVLGSGGLIGKFVIYYNTPHEFQAEELQIAQTIAAHVAFAAERRQAEMALRASEERFRVMFLQAAVGIAQTSLDGEWLLVNDGFCEILGYTQAELCGKTFLDVTHPDDRENSLAARRQMVAGEISSWSTEKRYIRKDGAIVWARLHVSLVRGPDGQPQYFIAVVQNITEKIQAENALRESERRLTLAQGAAHIGVWDADLDTNITTFSGDYASLYGLPNDYPPLAHEEWIALVHPADRDRVESQLRESIEQRRFLDTEFRVVWPDGSVHWLLGKGTVFLDNSGRPIRMAGVNLDITARKDAEAALLESEERFRSLFENATVGLYRTTPAGRIEMANSALVRMLGYESFAALAERNLEESGFEPEYSRSAFRKTLEQEGQIHGLEATWTRNDGSVVFVRESARCVKDESGAVCFYEGIVEDVTERKRTEDALRRSEQKFAAAFHLGPAAMSIVDTEDSDCILDINEGFEQVSGYSRVELLGRRVPELGIWSEPEEYSQAQRRFRTDGRLRNFEFHFRRKSGEIRTGLVSTEPMEINNRRCAITCTTDLTERKRAEEALRENEQRIVSIYNTVEDVIFQLAVEPEGQYRFVSVNAAFLKVTGMSQEEVVGKTVKMVIPEPSLTMVLGKYRQAAEENTIVRWEETSDYPTGRMTGAVSVAPVFDNKGTCTHLVGSVHDITERKLAEEALRKSEERFRYVIENLQDAVWSADLSGQFEFLSPLMVHIYGRPLLEMVADPAFWIEAAHPEDKATVQASGDVLRRDGHIELEYRILLPDGTERWIFDRKTQLLDAHGKPSGIAGIISNITERKRAEEILKASEEKYRALVETTDTGYLITDKEGKVIDANREYVRLTGHSELGEILGRSVIEWTAAHEKQKNAEALARCVKDGFIRDLVIDYVDGENRITPVEINAKVTRGGESLRIISLCRDISDRKRAEEMRLQLKLTQAQKMESIGRLAGGVAHDFNNLLTVINGYAAFLSEQLAVPDPLRRYALEIGEAGRRAASLTSQLLAFSRKQAIMPKAINLNAVLADAERMLQRLIGEDIELVSSLAPRLGLVMADPDQIHQIIMNLAVNARDAMPKGGKFEITTAEVELNETAAAAYPDAAPGRYVQLTVTDTGTGMTEEVRRKIFEPFFTTKEPGKGTGLGLSMVFGIVRQHDGWIDVKSEPGRGSTFRIHLPRIDGGSRADEAKPAAANVSHGDETVLVVEDQEAVRRLARRILEAHGYHVLEAASGAEAHAVASRHVGEIDLLLTDVVMPGMDGYLLSEQLRDLRPNLRTILMSGYAADLIAHRDALASGLAYIQKPFGPEELATKVRGVLDSPV